MFLTTSQMKRSMTVLLKVNRVHITLTLGIFLTISVGSSPLFSTDCDLDTVAKEIARKRPHTHPCAGWSLESEIKLSRRACQACLGALIPTCQRQNTPLSTKDIQTIQDHCATLTNPK